VRYGNVIGSHFRYSSDSNDRWLDMRQFMELAADVTAA
jgi:hypothetical protein